MNIENEKIEVVVNSDFVPDVVDKSTEINQNTSLKAQNPTLKSKTNRKKTEHTGDEEKNYKCTKCCFETNDYSRHLLHACKPSTKQNFTITFHKNGNIFGCSCGYIFHKLKSFHEHLVCHIIAKPYRCSQCKSMFVSRKEINKHLISAHPQTDKKFHVNGLKFTSNMLEEAKKKGSYTHYFQENTKSEGSSSKISDPVVPESTKVSNINIVIDDEETEKASTSIDVAVKPIPVGLFRNVNHTEMFKFEFTPTFVKYTCTLCSKNWENKKLFSLHMWIHQHENAVLCDQCVEKEGESHITCPVTTNLFHTLSKVSYTKAQAEAVKKGALRNMTIDEITCTVVDNCKIYKCTVCDINFPYINALKWHVWQHSHSTVICSDCHIMKSSGTKYILCSSVEKIMEKLNEREQSECDKSQVETMSSLQGEVNVTTDKDQMTKNKSDFGSILKNKQTVYVCYLCSKQWTDKERFWLHVWTHCHNSRKPCNECKKIVSFPGMSCSVVDRSIDLYLSEQPESPLPVSKPATTCSTSSDNRITGTSIQSKQPDILIIEEDSTASHPVDKPKVVPGTKHKPIAIDDDEIEIFMDNADDGESNYFIQPSKPSTSVPLNIASTSVLDETGRSTQTSCGQAVTSEFHFKNLANNRFPSGLIRKFLSSENVARAMSSLYNLTKDNYQCLICNTTFHMNDLLFLHEHLAVKHMKIPLLKCGHCDFNGNKEGQISNHCRTKHPGKMISIHGYDIDIYESVSQYMKLIKLKQKTRNIATVVPPKDTQQPSLSAPEDALLAKYQKFCQVVDKTEHDQTLCVKGESALSTDTESCQINRISENHGIEDDRNKQSSNIQILSTFSLAHLNRTDNSTLGSNKPHPIRQDTANFTSTIEQMPVKSEFSQGPLHTSHFSHQFYACGSCSYSTLIMEDLRKHLFTLHASAKQFPCKHCGFLGLRIDQLMKHFVYHTNLNAPSIPVFQCTQTNCEYRCNVLDTFISHIEKHDNATLECHECFASEDNLNGLRLHYEENLLFIISCPHCTAIATEKNTMIDHIGQWHDGMPTTYSIIKQLVCRDRQIYGYTEQNTLRAGQGKSQIDLDGKMTCTIKKEDTVENVNDMAELSCKLCSFIAVSSTEISSHMNIHTNIPQDIMAYLCPFCKSGFRDKYQLECHQKQHAETQMTIYYFQCKCGSYKTNVYQNMLDHMHDGKHEITTNPKDMYHVEEVSLQSSVVTCSSCTFRSVSPSNLAKHVKAVHESPDSCDVPSDKETQHEEETHSDDCDTVERASPKQKGNLKSPLRVYKCPNNSCLFLTSKLDILKLHAVSHEKQEQDINEGKKEQDTTFADINTYKKDFHLYIPTDGPENQENLHLLTKRVKPLFAKIEKTFKCKLCKVEFKTLDQTLRHILRHLKIEFLCHMCQITSTLLWKLTKHAKKQHACKYFNIIYSDKIEEAIHSLISSTIRSDTKKPDKFQIDKTCLKPSVSNSAKTRSGIKINQKEKSPDIKRKQKHSTECSNQKNSQWKMRITEKVNQKTNADRKRKKPNDAEEKDNHLNDAYFNRHDKKRKVIKNSPKKVSGSTVGNVQTFPSAKPLKKASKDDETESASSIQWSTTITDKTMCLLGSDYLDEGLSALYTTENNKHQCRICQNIFPAITRYWIHHHLNLNHLKIDLYQCGYCDMRAIEKFKIHQHLSSCHTKDSVKVKDIDFNINHAVYNFIRKSNLNIEYKLKDKSEINTSIARAPEKIYPELIDDDGRKVKKLFRCEHCHETFQYEIKAKMHSNTEHPNIDPIIKLVYNKASTSSTTLESEAKQVKSVDKRKKSPSIKTTTSKKVKTVDQNKDVFKCPQCNFTTNDCTDTIKVHFKSHNYEELLECGYCGVRFFNEKASKKHHRLSHQLQVYKFSSLPLKEFFKVIKSESSSPSSHTVPSVIDTRKPKFQCIYCKKQEHNKNLMKIHLLNHLPEFQRSVVCSVCSLTIKDPVRRKTHFLQMHKSDENSKEYLLVEKRLNELMDECQYKEFIEQKKEIFNRKRAIQCYSCSVTFENLTELRNHSRMEHKLSSNIYIYWKDAITGGTYNLHGLMIGPVVDLQNMDVVLCNLCDYRCSKRSDLFEHYKNHNGKKLTRTIELRYPESHDDATTRSHQKDGADTGKDSFSQSKFRCSECQDLSYNLYQFREHLGQHSSTFTKLVPSLAAPKCYICRICNFSNTSKKRFEKHLEKHTDFKQFSCGFCLFEANQITPVKLHSRVAHPNKDVSIVDKKIPHQGQLVDFDVVVKLKNFFEMTPNEFENLLNSAKVGDVDLSSVSIEIAAKLLAAYE
ncbi:hypothetical protein SNE40_018345 [Patella caerulea]|uniref:C2H2-type domain-containing protein n=1 Tax=Patella caerulea TaxID=87958 RepID=A0AAN8J8J7_PATCE